MQGQKPHFQKSLKRFSNIAFLVNSQDRLSYYLGKAETLFKISNVFEVENLSFPPLAWGVFIKFNRKHIPSRQVSHSKDSYIYVPILGSSLVIWYIGLFCKTFFLFKYLLISTLNHIHTKKTQAHNLNIRNSFWRVDQDEDNTFSEKSEDSF